MNMFAVLSNEQAMTIRIRVVCRAVGGDRRRFEVTASITITSQTGPPPFLNLSNEKWFKVGRRRYSMDQDILDIYSFSNSIKIKGFTSGWTHNIYIPDANKSLDLSL